MMVGVVFFFFFMIDLPDLDFENLYQSLRELVECLDFDIDFFKFSQSEIIAGFNLLIETLCTLSAVFIVKYLLLL